MRYRFSRVFEFVILCLLFLSSASAQTLVRVNEHAARIQFLSEDTVVDLSVENPSRDTISAHLLLELVDPAGVIRDRSEQDVPRFLPAKPSSKPVCPSPLPSPIKSIEKISCGTACATPSRRPRPQPLFSRSW